MNFLFTNEYPISRLDEIVNYLLGPRLWIPRVDYPDFSDWAQKTYQELKKESKRALVAIDGHEVVGVSVYQRHKKRAEALEIKNLTIRPDKRGRHIASFLLRNTEIEGTKEFNSKLVLCDAKVKNWQIKYFLLTHHYQIVTKTDLYNRGAGEDLVYRKNLNKDLYV